jgi:hypothetical protein
VITVFHDLHPFELSFEDHLRRLVPGLSIDFLGGTLADPWRPASLLKFVAKNPGYTVVRAVGVSPALGGIGNVRFRPVIPFCHPMIQTMQQFRGWSRDLWIKEHGAPPTDDQEPAMIVAFIQERMQQPWRLYPPINIHLHHLTGEPGQVDDATALAMADKVLDHAVPILVDFPSTRGPTITTTLLTAGAPIEGNLRFAMNGDSRLLSRLENWRQRLPDGLFDTLCGFNRGDLILYDIVAAAAAKTLPMIPAERERVVQTLEEAAKLTGHRALAFKGPGPDGRRAGSRLVEADPELGYRLSPNVYHLEWIKGRQILQETDDTGYRPVPGQPKNPRKSLAAYGCSFAFGFGNPVEDTFCAVLQRRLPDWRIENRGVSGYGTHQNLIQLQRDSHWDLTDYVAFCSIPDHYRRNVAAPTFVQNLPGFARAGTEVTFYPRAGLQADGTLTWRKIATRRPEILGVPLSDFVTDQYYMEQVYVALVREAARLATAGGAHFFIVVVQGSLSDYVRNELMRAGIAIVDATAPNDEQHTFLPQDAHPNGLANVIFADRIESYLRSREDRQPHVDKTVLRPLSQ